MRKDVPEPGRSPEVDDLLRRELPDDLPPAVEARLAARVDRFLADRRREAARPATLGERLLSLVAAARPLLDGRAGVLAATALLVAGVSFQWVGAFRTGSGPLPRLSATVTIAWEIQHAGAPRCEGGGSLGDLAPGALSGRVWRDWALVRQEGSASTGARLLFRALDEPAFYELSTDPGSFRPRRLRRLEVSPSATPGAPVDGCEWPPAAGGPETTEGRTQ
ncbi:hypothetical protein FBQ97_04115 [Acidobacteria bacterium ACD]|nr:MAG: hypothetical protein EDX89_03320 [Acidobacteriota bacterium]MDL1948982.1 hypothetical protein [Acidobacteria bacterium ACD]